ncbi:hypothetical protein N799_08620 [Lysobacter arseniciresistens ZS79]|uniref:Glycine zipper domain-containing protein n=1 Tax=Lysobacter arseniciresistens ZS79 TaxID=913325 RepID=A0A0A0EX09_9GAMM|nr:hypothetical protein [Lysobacter arseniciresistens]KGM54805.1 hypothetical protein N799_08620 [Lysobacter arseniciresistens ZS79]
MKTKITLITAGIVFALSATSAQAGVRDWFKKKDKPEVAEVSPAEFADCKYFLLDEKNGKVALTPANAQKSVRCHEIVDAGNADAKTLETVEVEGRREAAPKVDQAKAKKSGRIGAMIGGLVGGALGIDPRAIPAVMAVGGMVGEEVSIRNQMKDARELEAAANAAGMKATVHTQQERVKGKNVEKLKGMSIDYKPADMQPMTKETRALMERIAGMASKSKANLVFILEGEADACQVPLNFLRGQPDMSRHTVIDKCGSGGNTITIAPQAD